MLAQCKRTVYKMDGSGEVENITVENHSFSWSGEVHCTGVYRCVHCGNTDKYEILRDYLKMDITDTEIKHLFNH